MQWYTRRKKSSPSFRSSSSYHRIASIRSSSASDASRDITFSVFRADCVLSATASPRTDHGCARAYGDRVPYVERRLRVMHGVRRDAIPYFLDQRESLFNVKGQNLLNGYAHRLILFREIGFGKTIHPQLLSR